MAHGYPDYWVQARPGLPMPGVEQEEFIWDGSIAIGGGATVVVIGFLALPGYIYYIAGGMISCDFPMIQRYQEAIDAFLEHFHYFDTYALLEYNPSALREVVAGETYYLTANNLDTVAHTFTAKVRGYRTAIVPGSPLVLAPVGVGLAIPGAGV